MNNITIFFTTVFLGFIAMLNPIGNTPVFISMLGDADDKTIKKVAFKAVAVAFAIITMFCLFGHFIFSLFGITLPAFQIAGGIIVFFIAYSMLQGKESYAHNHSNPQSEQSYDDMAISPLGIPLLSGPGTISTAMSFVGEGKNFSYTIAIVAIFALVCVITYFMFVLSKRIAGKLSPSLIKVFSRIMGLMLAVISIQMIINGVFKVIHEYPAGI